MEKCDFIFLAENHTRKAGVKKVINNIFNLDDCVHYIESIKANKKVDSEIDTSLKTLGWDHDDMVKMAPKVLLEWIFQAILDETEDKFENSSFIPKAITNKLKQKIKKMKSNNFTIHKRNNSLIKSINESCDKFPNKTKLFSLGYNHVKDDQRIEDLLKSMKDQQYIIFNLTRSKIEVEDLNR